MPWPSDHIPKYRKHRASGQAMVTISRRDFYRGPHGTQVSRRVYDGLIAAWLAAGRFRSFGAAQPDVSVAELNRPQ